MMNSESANQQIQNRKSRFMHHVSRFTGNHRLLYVLPLLLALLAAAPLWGSGMVNTRGGGDSPFLLQRVLDMAENLRHGNFPPRWMAHAAYDLGYPLFNYYAALPYYLAGGLTALGLSPIVAIQTTQTLGFILAAFGMALWARRMYANQENKFPPSVWIAVAAYTFAPFHLVNAYVRGDSLSEFYAFVWYPFILWSLDRWAERRTPGRLAVASLSYGALILTHNTSALTFSPFALLYAVVRMTDYELRITNCGLWITHHASRFTAHYILRLILSIAAPFVLGFLLTAWFWLPALGETKYGQLGAAFTEGYFHYSRHFRTWNLVQRAFAFDYSVAGRTEDAGPFAMGMVQAVLTIAGAAVLFWQLVGPNVKRQMSNVNSGISHSVSCIPYSVSRLLSTIYCLFSLFLSTLMITPLSKPLWDYLPLLSITQFPWRFLSIQALFTAIVTGEIGNWRISESANYELQITNYVSRITSYVLRFTHHWGRSILTLLLCVLTIVAALLRLHPDRLLITDADVTWENLLLYETFTGNIGTTIRYEYLPEAVVPRLYMSEAVLEGQGRPIADAAVALEAVLVARAPTRQVWQVTLAGSMGDEVVPVVFPLNWWPGWQAQMDGVPIDAYPMSGSGRLTVELPMGEHSITLRLRNTPLRTLALVLSGVTLVVGIGVFWQHWQIKKYVDKVDAELRSAQDGLRSLRANEKADQREGASARNQVRDRRVNSPILLFAIFTFAISILLPLAFHRPLSGEASFFDFIQMPYLHRGAVDFGPVQLESVQVPAEAVPGESLDVELTWLMREYTPLTATVRLVSPAAPRHNVPYTLAETQISLPCFSVPLLSRSSTFLFSCSLTLPIPDEIAQSLYLIEVHVYGPDGELLAHTPQGHEMGVLYAGVVRVVGQVGEPIFPVPLATFSDLTLHSVETGQSDPATLRVKLAWSTPGTPRNWSLSLRLLDVDGRQLAQLDAQPGYGYLPTTLWQPDEWVYDTLTLSLPKGLAPGQYTLQIVTYLQATMAGGGEVDVPVTLDKVTRYDAREACCEQERKGGLVLCDADDIALVGLELPETWDEGSALDFYAQWNVLSAPATDIFARWEVVDVGENIVGSVEGRLAPGSYPITWPRLAWVRASVNIPLPALLPNAPYHLRLTLSGPSRSTVICELPHTLPLVPRPRLFTLPDLRYTQEVRFGEELQLRGYDIDIAERRLALTLCWQVEDTPAHDYKRFVHFYDPATEQVLAQDDAMPRAWAYPTTWWLAGEVVSETVTLDLTDVPPGLYRLGIGWYDPNTVERLPAVDAAGTPLPANRATLDVAVQMGKRYFWDKEISIWRE
ncbi:MAG: hypothetical protein JXA33_11565 [Anaerolineae bacterium]|nr:hypothetical protein [Anaerolineae bacterium]